MITIRKSTIVFMVLIAANYIFSKMIGLSPMQGIYTVGLLWVSYCLGDLARDIDK